MGGRKKAVKEPKERTEKCIRKKPRWCALGLGGKHAPERKKGNKGEMTSHRERKVLVKNFKVLKDRWGYRLFWVGLR